MHATQVFVPSDFPTFTYVERGDESLEKLMREALMTPRSPIAVSGPSKSGKTALVRKVIGSDNLIHIFGNQVESTADLWKAILLWMDAPSSISEMSTRNEAISPEANASIAIKIPTLIDLNLGGKLTTTTAVGSNATVERRQEGLSQVQREISNSNYVVFLDDFHYINRSLQEEVGRQIKSASELGIRFCIASVPHRSDDVVRSNHELRGRTINIDTKFWPMDDLQKIAVTGFDVLNVDIDPAVVERLASEACTSPQIMQSLCLDLCFKLDILESLTKREHLTVGIDSQKSVLLRTSTRTDYSGLLKQMYAGPRIRGTERKEFDFRDGSRGDVYRAALLSLADDPPAMQFQYSELLSRVANVCIYDKPVGGSLTEALKQIAGFAEMMFPNQRIVEWDPEAASGTFAIIDPYFLFFLRSSDMLAALGKPI